MSRVLLVHWNAGEAKAKARTLKELGYTADILCDSEKPNLARIRESPPDLFLIDLNRLPSHGREIAGHFRRDGTIRIPNPVRERHRRISGDRRAHESR